MRIHAYMHTDTRSQSSLHHPSASKYIHTHTYIFVHGQGGPGAPGVVGSEHHLGLADRVHPQLGPRRDFDMAWPGLVQTADSCDASWSDQGYLMSPHCSLPPPSTQTRQQNAPLARERARRQTEPRTYRRVDWTQRTTNTVPRHRT